MGTQDTLATPEQTGQHPEHARVTHSITVPPVPATSLGMTIVARCRTASTPR